MSKGREVKVLEISNQHELQNLPGSQISCEANAEWSEGYGGLHYGAHVSDGGDILLEYQRQGGN